MSQIISSGSLMMCSQGMIPCPFQGTNAKTVLSKTMVGVMQDCGPANIASFGMCISTTNPTVVAATTAALGVLTPMPCKPMIVGTWICNSKVLVKNTPVLTTDAKCMCAYNGNIRFLNSIQMNVLIQ